MAGGCGTRLYPITNVLNKHLLPIYDKPMIYYPMSILMMAGIRDILLITNQEDLHKFKLLFGDGSQLGLNMSYAIQPRPNGLAQAFIIGRKFIDDKNCCLILGDNLFFGHRMSDILHRAVQNELGSVVFGYWVKDPERYGIVEFDQAGNVISVEEKPSRPKSNYAVPGLYFFDRNVVDIAFNLKPSKRGELEITDVIETYLRKGELKLEILGRGFAWLDTGTHESYLQAGMFIETIQNRTGLKIACLEEVAWRMGYINGDQVRRLAKSYSNNQYGHYLMKLLSD